MVPSGSVPVPENATAPSGLIVTFVAGLLMVAAGPWLLMDPAILTNFATDGTPAELSTKSM